MATSTTNLGLTKPAGTDKIRIAQINGNMDILDEKIGAVGNTSLQAQVTSQNQAIAKLDSNANETTDILASAVNCTKTTFFKTSGSSSYVGTLPSNDYKVSTFIVTIRGGGRLVTAVNSQGAIATNYYNGSSWNGWQELALKSDIANIGTDRKKYVASLGAQANGFRSLIVNLPQCYTGKTVSVSSVIRTGSNNEYLSDFSIQDNLSSGYFVLYTSSSEHTTTGLLYTVTYSIS